MPKRAALLFDQLMVALQKVVDNQGRGELGGGSRTLTRSSGSHLPSGNSQVIPSADEQTVRVVRNETIIVIYNSKLVRVSQFLLNLLCVDGSSTTRTGERPGLLALLLQRRDVLQEKVITSRTSNQ